jgi:uncharacterized protein YcbK (DUF882 family)
MAVRKSIVTLLAALFALAWSGVDSNAYAGGKTKAAAHRSVNDKGSKKVCSRKGKGKKRCSRVRIFQGHGVAAAALREAPLDRPSGEIWLHAENLNEEVKLNIFREDGSYDEGALAKLDELFRCKRTNEVRAVNPKLYEQLSRMQDHFDKKRIELVSGFRFAERNSSRHFHASAMDIRIPDVSIREMYAYAESLDPGGMGIGIYPNSGFIHVDLRAPGDPSYRWTDLSGGSGGGKSKKSKKQTGRTKPARKPVS